jgi:hypothetical protein
MLDQYAYHPAQEENSQIIYLSCCPEDLIAVEMDAWACGFREAGRVETSPEPDSIRHIERAAEQVCDQALRIYVPLDLDRFRDVFTRAWCAGYCTGRRRTEQRQQQPAGADDIIH